MNGKDAAPCRTAEQFQNNNLSWFHCQPLKSPKRENGRIVRSMARLDHATDNQLVQGIRNNSIRPAQTAIPAFPILIGCIAGLAMQWLATGVHI